MTLEELTKIVDKYLLLADKNIIKFLCAVAVANKIQALTPTWVFLVGASSGGKSTLLEPFRGLESKFISDLSAKTLFSSMKSTQQDAAAITRFPQDGGLVIFTDFTLILEKDELVAKEIMSQFRLIFDGGFEKLSGNNSDKSWSGRFGLILGVTTAVYEKQQQYAAVGERMIYYNFDQPDRINATIMALENLDKTDVMKAEIANAYAEYINGTPIPDKIAPIDKEFTRHIIRLSEMATRARSSVSRNKFKRDNPITQINALEMPMRFAKQILNVAQGLIALNQDGQLHEEDKIILYKAAIDSIPKSRKEVMETLTEFHQADIPGVATKMGLPYETVKMVLEDLAALGVVTQHRSMTRGVFHYQLQHTYRELISSFLNIEMTDKTLEKQEETAPLPEDVPLTVEDTQRLMEAQLL